VKEHLNFYENLKEAHIRLRNTVVMYDGEPYSVLAITDHMKDGIFRVYMQPIGGAPNPSDKYVLATIGNIPSEHSTLGPAIDKAMTDYKGHTVVRKQMNSPLFKKFRPFPLGMYNHKGAGCRYLERQPVRQTHQGLTSAMIWDTEVTTSPRSDRMVKTMVNMQGESMRHCILGQYPTAPECLAAVLDPKIKNDAVGFHRQFAFALGPIDMVFLAYKGDIVGVLPHNDFYNRLLTN
jgi:hypothetical protein